MENHRDSYNYRVICFLNQVEVTENTDVKSIICYDLGSILQPNVRIVEL